MASFKIGRIKGEKGEKGDTGAKGEKGEKGDKGETGANGADGYTPIFTVGETKTLAPQSDAAVTISSDDPKNPVISFFIPRGADGKSACGDMQKSVYDENGKETDVYEYADSISQLCMKKTGGSFTGGVTVISGDKENLNARNIGVFGEAPQEGKTGDICIINTNDTAITLGSLTVGTTVLIEENKTDARYVICDKDYHTDGSVTLVREYLMPCKCAYDRANLAGYAFSTCDVVLSTMFILNYSNFIKQKLINTQIEANVSRKVFLPSTTEMENLSYFKTNSKTAKISENGSSETYFLRTPYGTNGQNVYSVYGGSDILTATKTNAEAYLRPMIVLPKDMCVKNADTGSGAGYKLLEKTTGIYVFDSGTWGEVLHGNN